jgi:hypothetical protein
MVAQGQAAQPPQPWVTIQTNPIFSSFVPRKANDEKRRLCPFRSFNPISVKTNQDIRITQYVVVTESHMCRILWNLFDIGEIFAHHPENGGLGTLS